ncbi:MAG: ATP-binding cassette domain-containing protein [Prochlorothrix sp.]|nr:ATP-binding cassette domain-containing protein [Prochlorothrix sp.]
MAESTPHSHASLATAPDPSPTPTIAIDRLNYSFGKGDLRRQILFDITLTLDRGEVVILRGPSGSGKTTLLTLIGGLRAMQEGSLRFLGQELFQANPGQQLWVRRQTGYVFQAHNLHHNLTARQNVMMGLEVHGRWRRSQMIDQAFTALEQVGLGDRADFFPSQLSGGQKQRVAVARALVSGPQLILADEPTAALDSVSGREVVILMQKLAKEQGCTVLLVTHDNRILDVADRILSMEDGRLCDDRS